MVRKSNLGSNRNNNMHIYIGLGILAFAIIVGTIMSSKYKERFETKTLVYFYMDNCPYCENFEYIWSYLVNVLKVDSKYSGINIQKINLNSNEAKEYPEITSAPTIMVLPSKKIYNGERTIDKILEWSLNPE